MGPPLAVYDYVAVPPTILTFDPGQTVKTVAVAVLGDITAEANETFVLNLSNPTNAVLADAQGVGTIIDDEATFIGSEGFGYSALHRMRMRPLTSSRVRPASPPTGPLETTTPIRSHSPAATRLISTAPLTRV